MDNNNFPDGFKPLTPPEQKVIDPSKNNYYNEKNPSSNKKPNKRRKPNKKKYKPLKITLLVIGVIAAGLILALIVYGITIISKLNTTEFTSNLSDLGIESQGDIPKLDDSTAITNIALFGVDRREKNTNGRSDAIMILSIDRLHNKIKISSIMRDSYVAIEGHGKDKICHAYVYGGAKLAVKTINQNFGLDITEYATVNFAEMAEIIDAVGGIEIEVSEAERKDANLHMVDQVAISGKPLDEIKKAGLQTLSGMQAVAFARIRNVGNSDFERTDRQREVMEKLFEKALKMPVTNYPNFANKILPITETSLDLGEIIGLSSLFLRSGVAFEQSRIPNNKDLINGGSLYVNGTSYLNYDLKQSSQRLKAFVYDDVPANDWYSGYVKPEASQDSAA
ncbi:MAG: LCP family protein [Oscillospiraceae bacterium]